MKFGIEKGNILVLKRGIKYENVISWSSLKEGKNYKYLGKREAVDINTKKMKEKVKAESLRCTRKFN